MDRNLLSKYKDKSIMLDRAFRNRDAEAVVQYKKDLADIEQELKHREYLLAKTLIALAVRYDDNDYGDSFNCSCCEATVEDTIREDVATYPYSTVPIIKRFHNPLYSELYTVFSDGELLLNFPHESDCPILKALEVLKENAIP